MIEPHAFTPAPAVLERSRCFVARWFALPIAYAIFRVALLLLPRTHPYRVFATDRAKAHVGLGRQASAMPQQGKRMPLWANVALVLGAAGAAPYVPGLADLLP